MLSFYAVNFRFGYPSGGPVIVTLRYEDDADATIETSVAALLDLKAFAKSVMKTFEQKLAPPPPDKEWGEFMRERYAAGQAQDGEPVAACPSVEELRDKLIIELADDPTGRGYDLDGEFDAKRVSKLLRNNAEVPNLLPQLIRMHTASLADYAEALKNDDVYRLATVGWANKKQALEMGGISLNRPDESYKATVPGPCRLDELFDVSSVKTDPIDRERAIADAIESLAQRA